MFETIKKLSWQVKVMAAVLVLTSAGCAKDAFNRALFSMGEQAQCAKSGEHRIDEHAYHANCIADAINESEYDEYSKARASQLED